MKIKTILLVILLSHCCYAFAQSNEAKSDSATTATKSKKHIYIENYIANFPYKNSEIYESIKQIALWDTTGAVPVIDPFVISFNKKPTIKTEKKAVFEIEEK
jgi:hypothetical protein